MVFPAIVADICNCMLEKGTGSEDEYCTPSKEHYGNEVSLNERNLSLKYYQSPDKRLSQQKSFKSF